jgi:prevent-host-death family protein
MLYNEHGCQMATESRDTSLRENLAGMLDRVVDRQETAIIRRRGARDADLLPASELTRLSESSKIQPDTVAELRREMPGETGS